MEGVLMQIVLTDHLTGLQLQAVSCGQSVHADQLYDLVQLCLILQKA